MNPEIEIPKDLLQSLQGQGFVLAKLQPRAQALIDATFSTAQQFFRSTQEEKLRGRLPMDLGYRGFAEEYSLSPDRPDQMESFSASLRGLELASTLICGLPLILYSRMLATVNILEVIAEAVVRQIARELLETEPPHQLAGAFRWWSFLQINYSFPSQVQEDHINDLHEDGCLITVATNNAPGLEVQAPSGEILSITTAPGEVLIMPGEILWLLSGGALSPLYHRVRPHRSYAERASIQYFGDISPSLCTPWIETEVNQGIDIGARVLKNPARYGLSEWK